MREYREDDVIASGLEFGFAFWRWYLILATSDFGPRRLYNIWLLRSPILIVSGKFCATFVFTNRRRVSSSRVVPEEDSFQFSFFLFPSQWISFVRPATEWLNFLAHFNAERIFSNWFFVQSPEWLQASLPCKFFIVL